MAEKKGYDGAYIAGSGTIVGGGGIVVVAVSTLLGTGRAGWNGWVAVDQAAGGVTTSTLSLSINSGPAITLRIGEIENLELYAPITTMTLDDMGTSIAYRYMVR